MDDGDGSENVTCKTNPRFSNFVATIPICRKCQMKANFTRDDFFSDPSLKRETKIRQCLFTSSTKREIRHFNVEVVQ